MTDISSQTLHIVAKELAVTLNEARAALEAYADRSDQVAFLEKCADQLHLAHGVLRLVEVYGAALLAEEMEHATRYLLASGHDQKRQIEGLDALMRSMVQLPTYLERVMSGGRDLALVLLPLLNDLRSVRGSPLLSEGTLLLLNLKSDQPAQPQSQEQGEPELNVTQWARRLRPKFQVGLLGYIRGERTVENLELLAKVAEKLERVATTQPLFQLWWVVGALLEGVRTNGLEDSATLKRLLGQADRQIKALYEMGEARYSENPPVDLLNNLLYYVARATTTSSRIAAVRASFKLGELLPVDDSIEQERESLSAPSVKLMRTVAAAIKEDLSKVKDVLDIFVRRGGGRSDELIPQLDLLKKISDTLGVLGLGELRQRVQQEVTELSEIVTDGKTPSDASLIKVAGVLLSVEDSLDDQLVRLILPTSAESADLPVDQDHEFRLVSEAVLRECIVNLARIKEAVSVSVQKPSEFPPQGLDNVPQLLRGITAGLLMLGKGRAVELMDKIGSQVRSLVEPGAPPADALRLERIADAIVSIEYYMETLQNGRNDPWYMLDNAETCIKALEDEGLTRVPDMVFPDSDAAKTMKIDPDPGMQQLTHPLASVPQPDAVDPQFIELFIEEAKEEIASIQRFFPMWDQNPMDLESLGILRRSFHTLKGSGRMVGARLIAEFGWSIENLLNRILDKTLSRSPGMMALLRSAVATLPQLVEQLETGRQNLSPADEIMTRAFAYADGREMDPGAPQASRIEVLPVVPEYMSETPEEQAPVVAAGSDEPAEVPGETAAMPVFEAVSLAPPIETATAAGEHGEISADAVDALLERPPSMDPMLHDIYSKETSSHVAEIRDYLAKRSSQPAPHPLPESVYRAVHTLSGSSKMAEAQQGIRVTEPLNDWIRKVYDNDLGLSDGGLATLADAVDAIEEVIAHINEATSFFVDQPALLERLRALEVELDAELANSSNETSTSMIVPQLVEPPAVEAAVAPETAVEPAEAAEPWAIAPVAEEPAPEWPALEEPVSEEQAPEELAPEAPVAETPTEEESVLEAPVGEPPSIEEPITDGWAAPETVAGEPLVDEPAVEHPASQEPVAEQPVTEDLAASGQPEPEEPEAEHAEPEEPVVASAVEEPVIAAAAVAALVPAPIAPAMPMPEEFDREIAAIYSEEATELLEAAEISLSGWNRDRKDKDRVAELQRQLHTLKGGARMAGIPAMGDLSHELETLVISIESGRVPADDYAHAVMQSSLDELARMRDAVSAGSMPAAATLLLGQIRGLESGIVPEPVAPVASAPAAAATPVETAEVPEATAAAPEVEWSSPAEAFPLTAPNAAGYEADAPNDEEFESPALAQSSLSIAPAPAAVLGEDSISHLEVSSALVLPGRESVPAERVEMARVDAELLDTMLNNAGEVSIFRARLDQQVNSIDFNLAELARTVIRLKEQLRGLEIETEAQVLNRHHDESSRRDDFDPLELDRYSALQTFSRALAETSGDVASIQGLLETLTREAQNLLTGQARVITELQNSLMRTRMVPFQRHVQRLTRLVRQAANDTGKRAELVVQGAAAELDRQMLERMVAPLEHMLRNAVIHGIETPERRADLGKPEVGRISVSLTRDGAEVVVVVNDDGAGINVRLIREKAIALGMVDRHGKLTDEEAMQLILEPGFSTAGHLTQGAGRGVGMDVVATEVKKLGGGLFIESTVGKGSRFTIRLPFTLAISQALIVRVAEETYALPLATVEGVVRLPRNIVARHLGKDAQLFEYGGQKYRFQQLGSFVGLGPTHLPESDVSMSVVLIRAGEHSTALVTDELVGSREIVVKSLGPQVSGIRGIAGATILGDGRIVIILDMGALVRSEWRSKATETPVLDTRDRRTFALVVDDSITVRRVTQRLLERNGMRVLTAKDGIDAVSLLQDNLPDIILLDIEMPRMDGYEVAAHVRNDPRLKDIPIVMITSRVSEKHRARAIELGVDDYLGKPYQESQLLDAIEPLVNRRSALVH
jgi:chemosensory pili system protein ChpA (sensor histidine kinase/response regulator)